MRSDNLPYSNNSVDNIYISHAIEHIEAAYVEKFISESFRVLKRKGVLRIACPDAEFLYNMSCFNNEYWSLFKRHFEANKNKYVFTSEPSPFDYLLHLLAAPKMRFYKNKIEKLEIDGSKDLKYVGYKKLMRRLEKGLGFRSNFPGDHISNWDFCRLEKLGTKAGFRKIIMSKKGGSISKEMQGHDFDLTHPEMSLYVDMMK